MTEQLALNRIADALDKMAAGSTPSPSPTPTPSAQDYNEIVSVEYTETMTLSELEAVLGELIDAVFGHLGTTNDEEFTRKFMNTKIIMYSDLIHQNTEMIFTPVCHSYYNNNEYIDYSWTGMLDAGPATMVISIDLSGAGLTMNQFVLSTSAIEAVTGQRFVSPTIPEESEECTCFPSTWKVVTTDTVETDNYTH